MEAIFQITPSKGGLPYNHQDDIFKYLTEKEGVAQTITFIDTGSLSEKQLMYAFLFGPIMHCAVNGFTAAGYEGVDKAKARYMLEAEFCKAEIYNSRTQKVDIYTESVAHMSKKRLYKFITDVLFFLETELGQRVPDAEAFKARMASGRNYEQVKTKR